jgi:hypothetical protein
LGGRRTQTSSESEARIGGHGTKYFQNIKRLLPNVPLRVQ